METGVPFPNMLVKTNSQMVSSPLVLISNIIAVHVWFFFLLFFFFPIFLEKSFQNHGTCFFRESSIWYFVSSYRINKLLLWKQMEVFSHETCNWNRVSDSYGGSCVWFLGLLRCGKSCRLRWINYLRPDLKRGNFSKEEEETIIRLHEVLGNRYKLSS